VAKEGSDTTSACEVRQTKDPCTARGSRPEVTRCAERDLHGVSPSRDHGGASRRGPSDRKMVRPPGCGAQGGPPGLRAVGAHAARRACALPDPRLAPLHGSDNSCGAAEAAVLCCGGQGAATRFSYSGLRRRTPTWGRPGFDGGGEAETACRGAGTS
jgi:hypothetical protein